jgi:hypothetical protein
MTPYRKTEVGPEKIRHSVEEVIQNLFNFRNYLQQNSQYYEIVSLDKNGVIAFPDLHCNNRL